jgi:Alpha/beta hydrolase of unknown function (DUF900)
MNASAPATDITQFDLTPIATAQPEAMLGYSIASTAPINVEEEPIPPVESVKAKIYTIARFLVESEAPELVISIHGYATQRSDAIDRYKKIYNYAVQVCPPKTHVFLGYLWPSEKPTGDPSIPDGSLSDKIKYAFQALPILPAGIFWGGIGLTVLFALLLLFSDDWNSLLTPLLILSTIGFSLLLTLILLRLSSYFRDHYRATNFGVLDLVEILRQIDQSVFKAVFVNNLAAEEIPEDVLQAIAITGNQWQTADREARMNWWDQIPPTDWKVQTQKAKQDATLQKIRRIKLSFIGHSMGCFVVTNAIRILSDVFDSRAIESTPTSDIGQVYCLSRLVLVAPDIPIETIMPRRANFLRSSLLRCEEAYVFCSEGDLALRLASTAANYFSFPAKTRSSGYRLGNVTVKRFANQHDQTSDRLQYEDYGIVNWKNNRVESPFDYLEIRSSNREHQLLSEIRNRSTIKREKVESTSVELPVADLFTYFDCTDYIDYQGDDPAAMLMPGKLAGVVTYALRKSALTLIDYVALSFAYFVGKPRYINVHGGYFDGILSQQVIYNVAFRGFAEFLQSPNAALDADPDADPTFSGVPFAQLPAEAKHRLLDAFAQQCQEKCIQVLLSPIFYHKNGLDNRQ